MSGNVVINGRTAVHKGSGGTLNTEDVCKHRCSGCCTATYPNVAKSGDTDGAASTVFVNGHPMAHTKSTFKKSEGDDEGKCGGVTSGTIKQMAEFISSSPNVLVEGKPAVRQGDQMVSNMRNTAPAPLEQPGAGAPPQLQAEQVEAAEAAPPPQGFAWETNLGKAMGTVKPLLDAAEEE